MMESFLEYADDVNCNAHAPTQARYLPFRSLRAKNAVDPQHETGEKGEREFCLVCEEAAREYRHY